MKKMIAIVLALMLCVTALSVSAFAAFEVSNLDITGSGIPGVVDWTPGDASGDMTEVEAGIWVKEIEFTEAATMEIKFAGNDTWDDTCNFGSATLTIDGEAAEMDCGGGSGNMALSVTEPCTLKFIVDLNGDVATVKVETVTADGGEGEGEGEGEGNPGMGDLSIAAVSVALLAATAGMVLTISKKEN